ncbi:MAG: thiamine pyrophosphate-binding protein [Pseudomonadota bacterium]
MVNTKFLRKIGESKATKISGARFMAETFKGYGLTHVFFVEAILRKTLVEMEALGIKRVLTHSEKAAAYMADGYARVSGRPGLCMAQSVGTANLASGLQDPYLGLSPVVALTGRKPPYAQYRNAYQEILHDSLFESVTKYNVRVDTVEQLPYLLRQALREATSGAPGPVHLDIGGGYAGEGMEGAEGNLDMVIEEVFTRYPSNRPMPETENLREAARILEEAERPVIVAGGGARSSGAGPEIIKLAEMLSIPVATSLNAKDIVVDSHPLNVGVVGTYSRWCANKVVSEADLVLFIGSHTGDQVTNEWTIPRPGTPVIQIDIDPSELGRSYANATPLLGDAKVTVQHLTEILKGKASKKSWAQSAQEIVKEWRSEVEPLRNSDAVPIRPERVCKEISDTLPSNGIVVVDTGYSGVWTGTMINLTHPGQSFIRAAGSLGWGFPASLGAKCGAPERPVVCFTGEGGFFYHLSELETASRCGINSVTVINNNHCLRQCLEGINKAYGDRAGKKEEMCMFKELNFARIAEEMGCYGIRVERPGEIAEALKKALASNRPALVDVVTDVTCKAPSPWTPPSK